MTVEKLTALFIENPVRMSKGARFVAKDKECTVEEVRRARKLARKVLKGKGLPKILILDIETAPVRAYVWNLWKQNVYLDQIISDWFMLTWSAKWLYEPYTHSDRLTGEEVRIEDDKRIVVSLAKLLEEAEVVVAHYGDAFDLPKIRSRMIANRLMPVSPYIQIDTKKVAAKQFGFSSNKLDALATIFDIENKYHTSFSLWSRCLEGEDAALIEMETYNKQDVKILEEVYLRLRPWITSHPSLSVMTEENGCPVCGSNDVIETDKFYYTMVSKFPVHKCMACGAILRGRQSVTTKDFRKDLLVSVAR